MRRPLRILANAATLVSLVACVALLLGWLRAQLGQEVWVRFVGHALVVHGADGREIQFARGFFFDPPNSNDPTYEGPDGLVRLLRAGRPGTTAVRFAGVEYYADADNATPLHRTLVVPVVYPILVFAFLPTLWAVTRARGRRRRLAGCCANCGYDLRESKDKCPECGTGVTR